VSNDNLGFPQGSVIGSSLANFTLDGLESECNLSQKTAINEKKIAFLDAQNIKYKPGSSITRKTLTSSVIRFADDFLVITNDEKQSIYILNKIKDFLSTRGLTLNDEKNKNYFMEE
jgi:RNA-directed DNA polymerase